MILVPFNVYPDTSNDILNFYNERAAFWTERIGPGPLYIVDVAAQPSIIANDDDLHDFSKFSGVYSTSNEATVYRHFSQKWAVIIPHYRVDQHYLIAQDEETAVFLRMMI